MRCAPATMCPFLPGASWGLSPVSLGYWPLLPTLPWASLASFSCHAPPPHPTPPQPIRLLSDDDLRLREGEEIYRIYEHEVPVRSTVGTTLAGGKVG